MKFWSLLRSPHTVQEVRLSGLEVYLTQEQDSAWNVMKLIDIPPADETEEPASLQWGIETLSLNDGFIHLSSDPLLPDGQLDLTQINITGSAGMRQDGFLWQSSSPGPDCSGIETAGTGESAG